jgi:hypothetical protein
MIRRSGWGPSWWLARASQSASLDATEVPPPASPGCYGAHMEKAPPRGYATAKRTEYAFGDLRRGLAKDLGAQGFGIDCQGDDKAT